MTELQDIDPETGLPRLYTLPQVAKSTGLSARALADGARAEKFDHVKLNGKRYMTRSQVAAMIEHHTRRSAIGEAEKAQKEAHTRAQRRLEQRLARRQP